jgi:hypothetical protein
MNNNIKEIVRNKSVSVTQECVVFQTPDFLEFDTRERAENYIKMRNIIKNIPSIPSLEEPGSDIYKVRSDEEFSALSYMHDMNKEWMRKNTPEVYPTYFYCYDDTLSAFPNAVENIRSEIKMLEDFIK